MELKKRHDQSLDSMKSFMSSIEQHFESYREQMEDIQEDDLSNFIDSSVDVEIENGVSFSDFDDLLSDV